MSVKSPRINKYPIITSKIKGIFYKKEETGKKIFYHFILPNIYHNDSKQSHTLNILKEYDQKVENFFVGNHEAKLDKLIADKNIHSAKIYKPMYREQGLAKNSDIQYTTFKAKLQNSIDLIVGLEYLMDVDCSCGNFTNNETHENVTYWTIYINEIKEVTKLER